MNFDHKAVFIMMFIMMFIASILSFGHRQASLARSALRWPQLPEMAICSFLGARRLQVAPK